VCAQSVDLSAFRTVQVDLWVLTKCRHYEGVGLMYRQSSSWGVGMSAQGDSSISINRIHQLC
jgi:hypothetical protein